MGQRQKPPALARNERNRWRCLVDRGPRERVRGSPDGRARVRAALRARCLGVFEGALKEKSDRVFPGVQDNSVSIAVFNGLQAAGYDGSVSIATDVSTFSGAFRDNVVAKISRMLDRLIANEDLNDPVKAPPVEENEVAEGETASDGAEKDNTGENVESVAAAE